MYKVKLIMKLILIFQLLDDFATKLIESEHYAQDDIASRRDQVIELIS